MPSFKPKANKKIKVCKKYSTTLDGKHKEFVNNFECSSSSCCCCCCSAFKSFHNNEFFSLLLL